MKTEQHDRNLSRISDTISALHQLLATFHVPCIASCISLRPHTSLIGCLDNMKTCVAALSQPNPIWFIVPGNFMTRASVPWDLSLNPLWAPFILAAATSTLYLLGINSNRCLSSKSPLIVLQSALAGERVSINEILLELMWGRCQETSFNRGLERALSCALLLQVLIDYFMKCDLAPP